MPDAIKTYWGVIKPGILFGNLVSAAAGFFLASRGQVNCGVLVATLLGIALVVASGCVLNNLFDRNMDRKMVRTRNRALARELISPEAAGIYASLLGIAGFALLWTRTNALTVGVVLAGFAVYAGVYTLCVKRNSVHATLIGSLAGAVPPLAGYCAVSGRFDAGAVILFLIFGFWQIPHAYAIAIHRLEDYRAADVPVLPVKRGTAVAKGRIVGSILGFLGAALMLTFGGYTGYGYLLVAAVLGVAWLYMAWSGYRAPDDRRWARKLFAFSLLNIFALCIMMSIDFTASAPSRLFLTYTAEGAVTPHADPFPNARTPFLSSAVECLHRSDGEATIRIVP